MEGRSQAVVLILTVRNTDHLPVPPFLLECKQTHRLLGKPVPRDKRKMDLVAAGVALLPTVKAATMSWRLRPALGNFSPMLVDLPANSAPLTRGAGLLILYETVMVLTLLLTVMLDLTVLPAL